METKEGQWCEGGVVRRGGPVSTVGKVRSLHGGKVRGDEGAVGKERCGGCQFTQEITLRQYRGRVSPLNLRTLRSSRRLLEACRK